MITFSAMTCGQAADEVMLRLGKWRTAGNISFKETVLALNRAVKEITGMSLPYKDWAYIHSLDVTNRTALPRDYLGWVRLLVSEDGLEPYEEARFADPREWFEMTDWQKRHSWLGGNGDSPLFTVWGISKTLRIFIHPNTDYVVGTAPVGYEYFVSDWSGILEYYRMPAEMSARGDTIPLPYEYEELVILAAMSRLIVKDNNIDGMAETYMRLQEEKERIIKLFQEKRRTEKRELDSFVTPAIPLTENPPEPGELPRKL